MKLELNMPKFQMPELRQINPFGNESVKALAIVIGAIIVISGAVYSAQLVKKQRSSVLPAQTEVEVSPPLPERVTPQPTVTVIPTATPTVIPTEEPVEVLPEIPAATSSPTLMISPVEEF